MHILWMYATKAQVWWLMSTMQRMVKWKYPILVKYWLLFWHPCLTQLCHLAKGVFFEVAKMSANLSQVKLTGLLFIERICYVELMRLINPHLSFAHSYLMREAFGTSLLVPCLRMLYSVIGTTKASRGWCRKWQQVLRKSKDLSSGIAYRILARRLLKWK